MIIYIKNIIYLNFYMIVDFKKKIYIMKNKQIIINNKIS